jgi:hypothetical protein
MAGRLEIAEDYGNKGRSEQETKNTMQTTMVTSFPER